MPSNDSPRLRLSLIQLIASALAATTAAIAGSFLGVNGTVVGAAIASVLSVAGTALYAHSLERTGARVRTVVPASARWLPARPAVQPAGAGSSAPSRSHPVARVAIAATVVFAAALAVLTGVELVAGRPVSDLVTGKAASGTTVFGSQTGSRTSATTPVPSVTVTVTPKVVVTTPTVTRTANTVTVTPTPTPTDTSGTVSPTNSATASGTPTTTPGA